MVWLSSTLLTRSADTAALGSITEIMQIIRNAMMICMVYWINAIMSPTCIVPASMLWPPTHTIRTEIPFMISIMAGIINVIARLTKRLVLVSSRFA